MGWSITEDLLCVADDGSVLVYDVHGAIKKTLTMGQVSGFIIRTTFDAFCTQIYYISQLVHTLIGQFYRPHFTVRHAHFESSYFPVHPTNLKNLINILQTSFSWSLL